MWGKLSRLSFVFALWAGAARAEVPAPDQKAIQDVIAGQIEAFRRDDGDRAFAFATPELQAMFGSVERFMGMVRNGYQPVYRPREFVFGGAEDLGDAVQQEMPVIGPDGRAYVAVYTMERDAAGKWRIGGCRLVERVVPSS
jgi:hypothetical protein